MKSTHFAAISAPRVWRALASAALTLIVACDSAAVFAQDAKAPPRDRERGRQRMAERGDNQGGPTNEDFQKMRDLQEKAQGMGPWSEEAQLIHQAHLNIFQQNGWTSESDQYALNLMQQVTNISPWNPREREEAFLNGVQMRFNLSPDQRQILADEMRRESMQVGMKHFRTMFPVVMEAVQTRLEKKPFTPEQVQKWSQNLKPVMDDALAAVERAAKKLEPSMTEDQRARLKSDMDALLRRHKDIEKMVQRWQTGNWSPTDWGLDNDPIHAAAVSEHRAKEARRNELVVKAEAAASTAPAINAGDESEWRKYVRWFITHYKCDERQTTQAESILKSCEKEAADYLGGRGKEIEKAEGLVKSTNDAAKRAAYQEEVNRLRRPIAEIFERMKRRLEAQVLTSEQRKLIPASAQPDKRAAQR